MPVHMSRAQAHASVAQMATQFAKPQALVLVHLSDLATVPFLSYLQATIGTSRTV